VYEKLPLLENVFVTTDVHVPEVKFVETKTRY